MKVSRSDIDAAIARIQRGESTPDDGNLLRARSASVWRLLETAWAESDSEIDDELVDGLFCRIDQEDNMLLTIEITLADGDNLVESTSIQVEARKFAPGRAFVGMLVDDMMTDMAADLEERQARRKDLCPSCGRGPLECKGCVMP